MESACLHGKILVPAGKFRCQEKGNGKITAIKRTMREAVARIRREGVAKGVRNKRRYVNYGIIAENKKGKR